MAEIVFDFLREINFRPEVEHINFRQFIDPDDLPELTSLIRESLDADEIDRAQTEDDISLFLKHQANFDSKTDMLVGEVEGKLAGFVRVSWRKMSDDQIIYLHLSFLKPQWRRKKIGSVFLHFAETRALVMSRDLPANQEQFLEAECDERETGKIALLEANGYQPARYYVNMIRDLELDVPLAPMPVGLRIRPAEPEHYRKILAADNDAFRDHWGHRETTENDFQWWINHRNFQPHLWKVAWDNDEVTGMVLNYIDVEENERFNRKRGYTEDISVRRPWRRRGLARSLLIQSMRDLKQRGMTEAALVVDTENPLGALELYRGVGFEEQRRSITYRKSLRELKNRKSKEI